jgi:hypothetical protein
MDPESLTLGIICMVGTLTAISAGALVITRRSADGDEDVTSEVEADRRSRLKRLESYRDL